ncbi:hypothetical protein D3C81_1384920 [compost metagenome]
MHLRTGRTGLGTRRHIGRPQLGFGMAFVEVFGNGQRVSDHTVLAHEQRHLAGGGESEDALAGIRLVQLDQGFFVGHASQLEGQGATQRPGGVQLVADDQVIAHGSAPSGLYCKTRRPLRGLSRASPLPQGPHRSCRHCNTCGSGRAREEAFGSVDQVRYSALIFTYSWDRSVVQMVSLHWPRPSSIRMVISSWAITAEPCASV